LFANVTFIIFNYDRCIEHFLRDALSTYYALPLPQIEEILKKATFIHPYGTVGRLSWEARDGIAYGAKIGAETLLEIASQLKTFSEQSTDKNVIRQLGDAMREASTIVFLGFAFHEQNMKLLAPKERSKSSRVFATAFSVSDSDSDAIRSSILDTIQVPSTAIRVEIRNDLKCAGLFEQYWRSLRAS
jgi:hypothetical protein